VTELIEKIKREGQRLPGGILKVDSFLNHQVDMGLMKRIGESFAEFFSPMKPDKVLTIESSGIAPAGMTALCLKVPLVVMKKQNSAISDAERFGVNVRSFTKGLDYELTISKKYLAKDERVVFVDDFLAMGEAALGVHDIVTQAEAELLGIGIVIEKSFQPGRGKLDALNIPVYSLARISHMSETALEFIE
jgi:xanthine phosphoribosyltransferase